MEAIASRTDAGHFTVTIERNARANITRLDLHVSVEIPEHVADTEVLRDLLGTLEALPGSPDPYMGAPDFYARLCSLIGELHEQDTARIAPVAV